MPNNKYRAERNETSPVDTSKGYDFNKKNKNDIPKHNALVNAPKSNNSNLENNNKNNKLNLKNKISSGIRNRINNSGFNKINRKSKIEKENVNESNNENSEASFLDRIKNRNPLGSNLMNNLLGKKKKNKKSDESVDNNDETLNNSGSELLTSITSKVGFLVKFKFRIMIISIAILFFLIILFATIIILIVDQDDNDGYSNIEHCRSTMSADNGSKMKVRTTHYSCNDAKDPSNCSLGSVGNVKILEKKGYITYDDYGYAIWKGGSNNFGEPGIDYLIVATAQEAVFNDGYHFNENINYFKSGDTFSIEMKLNDEYVTYNAIVLDGCGACMSWSPTSIDSYAPDTPQEIAYAEETNYTKIDLFTSTHGLTAASDVAFMMDGITNGTCVGQIDMGELVVGTNDTKLLQGISMYELYGADGISELNNAIIANSTEYGYGTGMGAAAAAITLINSLKEKGYRLPYYWAGGHSDGVSNGINTNWGSPAPMKCTGGCHSAHSLDCSGFVSWAIRNGGCINFNSAYSTGIFVNVGERISPSEAKPGDILVYNNGTSGHVLIVVQVNDNEIILAESSGGNGGVHFTLYNPSSYSNYHFRDMSSFYSSSMCK